MWTINYHPLTSNLLPFELKSLPAAKVGRLTTVTLQTSTDKGETWHSVRIRPTGHNRYVATLITSPNAPSVSLKATTADTHGNTLTQEITHVYDLTR